MKKILITGASGFLGRQILERALQAGGYEITAVRKGSGAPVGGVAWRVCDLRDEENARGLIREIHPDIVVHAAWIATPGIYNQAPENEDWLRAGAALADEFGRQGGRHFIGIGTCAEYGPSDAPCREDETPVAPNTLYGRCKAGMHAALMTAAEAYGFTANWARVFVPYGPGDDARRLIPSVAASLKRGEKIETTHGKQQRDFIHVRDIADLVLRMIEAPQNGAYNIGSGQAVAVGEVISFIAAHYAREDLVAFGARDFPAHEPMMLVADMDKVARDFDWRARISWQDGLRDYLMAMDTEGAG